MAKKNPIQNNDKIFAHTSKGELLEYAFGKLKQDFISGKLSEKGIEVVKVYLPRTNTNWFVSYRPTAGFNFKKVD